MDNIEEILYGTAAPTVSNDKIVEAQVKLNTDVEIKENGKVKSVKHEEKILEKKLIKGPTAYLSIKYSSTIPLGDFRMCRVEKSLFLPVGVESNAEIEGKIQKTHDWGCTFLEKLMEKEVTEALAEKAKSHNVVKEEDVFGQSL